MNKVKNLVLFIVVSLFFVNIGNVEAKVNNLKANEIGLDIVKEGQGLGGCTLKLEISRSNDPINTTTFDLDLCDMATQSIKSIVLEADPQHLMPSKMTVSLFKEDGVEAARDYIDLLNLNHLTGLQIHIDAFKVSIDNLNDRIGMATIIGASAANGF